jgi:hypothetical protein
MLKNVFKRFCDKIKLNEAKQRAMKMYEDMIKSEKIKSNRKLEETMTKNKEFENIPEEKLEEFKTIENEYKSEKMKQKVESLIESFSFVDENKNGREKLTNFQNKIEGETLYYKLPKDKVVDNEWVKIYEQNIDEKFFKFKNFFKKLFIAFVIIKTFKYYKKYKTKELFEKKSDLVYFGLFYTFCLSVFLLNRSFTSRTIFKILLNYKTGDKAKLYLTLDYIKPASIETDLINIFSITSRSKNLHEILIYDKNNKIKQIFAPKNAFYDPNLLVSLCHPRVRKIKFTDI